MSHPWFVRFIVGLALVCALWAPAGAQAIREAPVNPAFLQGIPRGDRALGYRPSPVDWSHLKGARSAARTVFPALYDLRAQGRVTAVRNQGSAGSCWVFATLASLESCLLPGETADYSENNLKNTHGFDPHPNTGGGNRDMSAAYLARWSGPIAEADDPYNPSSTTSPPGLTARKHVQQTIYLPDRGGPTDNNAIKQALMDHGAVMTLYYMNDSHFNDSTAAYYNPTTTSVNHAVAIVGWDDNYSASNFLTAPPGNGAFLVKNSWGTSWGISGYFYISYYEPTLLENTAFYNAEATSNYTRCYQYDPLGLCSNLGYGANTGWGANIFTAAATERIAAVSTYAVMPNTTYQLSIYVNPTSGPIGGTPVLTQTGAFTDAGYHSMTLTSPVQVTAGQRFSVVMKFTTPGYTYPIPVERPYGGYSSQATAATGQSYVSSGGTTWSDVTGSMANTNICLKAFTQPAGSTLTAVNLAAGPASPRATGTAITLTATPTGGATVLYKFEVGSTTLRNYATGNTAVWTPNDAGTYTLKVSAYDTLAPATVFTKTLSYAIYAPLSAVSLTTSLASPRALGQTIRLTAVKTGGLSVQYQFSASSNGGATWSILQSYGMTAYKDWAPGAIGNYLLKVTAREGTSGTPVESAPVSYTIASPPPTAVALAASPVSPQVVGAGITLTATKTGGAATVQYKFEVNGGLGWTLLRDFAVTATVSWTPSAAGSYTLKVTVREPALPAVEVTKTLPYTIADPLSAVAFTTSLTSPQPVNKTIRLTAVKTGGANVRYQYYYSTNSGSTWSVMQSWTTASYKDWKPTSARNYTLKVAAREGTAGVPVESAASAFTIAPAPPSAVNLTASPISPRTINTAITIIATKTGGTYVEYKFESSTDNGLTWTTLRDFAQVATCAWTPATAASYRLRVSARESALPGTVVTKTITYMVTEILSGVSLTASLTSPRPVKTTIRLTGVPAGGANVQYQFSYSKNSGLTWSTSRSWSTTAYYNWVPSSTGNYLLRVSAREGSTGLPFTSPTVPFTVVPAPPTAVALSFTPTSPRTVNTAIMLKATKSGGTLVEYQFETSANGGAAWSILQAWSTTATVVWQPADPAAYQVKVSARESTYPSTVVSKMLTYTITPVLTAAALATSLPSPQRTGMTIRLTPVKTGGASVQYQYYYSTNSGATWSVLQSWTTATYKNWRPTTAREYQLKVAAREGSTGVPVESPVVSYTITTTSLVPKTAWRVSLVARTGGENRLISVGETFDQAESVSAEEDGGLLSLYLEQPGQPALAEDYHPPSMGQQQWQFVVKRDPGATAFEDIVLTWPDMGVAPRELSLTLVDLATGARRYLRTAGHYVIPAARGAGEHRFQLTALREPVVPLQIVGLHSESSRASGARVSYTLTRSAQVTLTVRALSGRVMSRLVLPEPQAAGLNTACWDGLTAAGAHVPPGTYQLELLANDDEDCRIRALTLVTLR